MKQMKGRSFIEKAGYFWTYYKTLILVNTVLIFVVALWIHAVATEKEIVLNVLLMDGISAVSDETMIMEFEEYLGISGKQEVIINSSYLFSGTESLTYAMSSISKFYSDVGTGKLDVCGFYEKDFKKYARSGSFLDLRKCFNEEELGSLAQYLYYEDNIPVGIYTEIFPGMRDYGCYQEYPAILGILYNSSRTENATSYLKFLLQK